MSGINVCATLGGNMGKPLCDVRMGRIKFLLLTTGKEFTEEDVADSEAFQDALQTAMLLPSSSSNKVFATPEMNEAADNTGDPNTGTLADGYEEVLNEALPKYLLRSVVGVCTQQQLASFNGWPGKVYIIDDQNILWYIVQSSGDSKGFSCGYWYTNPPKFKGSGDVQTANTRITFGSIDEFKQDIGALKLDFSITSLINLQDVQLSDLETENISGSLNNVFIIGAKTVCERKNLYDNLSTSLAAVGKWQAYKADGTAITITTVTVNSTKHGWNITLDSTTYNAMSHGDVFYINLADPATLHAAGIDGYEGKKIRFVKY